MDLVVHDTLATLVSLLAGAYALRLMLHLLRRRRTDLNLALPVATAFGIRIATAVVLALPSLERTLRGGDELVFLDGAHQIATAPLGSSPWLDAVSGSLHEAVFAMQLLLFDSPDFALRVVQATIAVSGLLLLATAVYELAGERAGRIVMWALALEPSNVFFSTILHKEPLLMLAGGLVAFGGTMIWKSGRAVWLLPLSAGCLVAVATRPYAGWFLAAAAAVVVLLRGVKEARARSAARSFPLLTLAVIVAVGFSPAVIAATDPQSLDQTLQRSQDANAGRSDEDLTLERVDFSTRQAIIVHLPGRMIDVLTKPYPWQLGNLSQFLGAVGTILALLLIVLLGREFMLARGGRSAALPLLMIAACLLMAYALSAGNAGTAFRYRTHIISITLAAVVVYYSRRRERSDLLKPAWPG